MKTKTVVPFIFLMIGVLICSAGCITFYKQSKDPYFETFFEKTRFIMRDEEKKIYRSLSDNASRKEFIEEFWKICVKATYQNDCFILKIPIERVTFEEGEERLQALYHLKIAVYKDNKVIDEVDETKTCSFLEEEVLDTGPNTELSSKKTSAEKQVLLPAEMFDFDVVPVACPQSVSFIGRFQTCWRGR